MTSLPVPVFAAAASTARIPSTMATALRRALAERAVPVLSRRLWAELARGYLTLALTLLPRPRPVRTITVFVAAGETLSARRYHSPAESPRLQGHPWPGRPDATP